MRRWLPLAGLVVVILVVVVLVTRAGKPPSPGVPAPAPAAPASPGGPGAPAAGPQPVKEADPVPNAFHDGEVDEGTRAVRSYAVTWKRVEAYVAAVREIRLAGQRDPALMAKLRQPSQPGDLPATIATRLEAIAPVKAILDRHRLSGIDLVLMPPSVAAGQNAYALEQEGRPLPADQQNLAATALYRADLPRMDELAKAFRAELKHLRPSAAAEPPAGP